MQSIRRIFPRMVRFRPNVAALMVRSDGRLLICERCTVRGAWQFPQGGVDDGESLEAALKREVREEIGLLPEHYDIERSVGGYRYIYPEEIRRKKRKKHGYHGQEQTYFYCRVAETAPEVDVNQIPREFASYRWIEPHEFDLNWLPDFKREVYVQVMLDFFAIQLRAS